MNRNWYLIHAKSRQENVAEMNLLRLGVETFSPRLLQVKAKKISNQEDRRSPLFPGYLFVKVDITKEFRKVAYAPGVIKVVQFGVAPAVVEEEIINSLKARDGRGLIGPLTNTFKSGQVVVIDKGLFRGFEALFDQKLNGTQRVALLLKTVAYQGRVVIDPNCLVE